MALPSRVINELQKGNAHVQAGRLKNAISSFAAAVHHAPNSRDARLALAGALAQAGKMDEALLHLRRVTQLAPQDSEAYVRMGWIAHLRNRDAEAENAFRAALDRQHRLDAVVGLARTLARVERNAEATEYWREAVNLHPLGPGLSAGLGVSLAALSQYEDAREAFLQEFRKTNDPAMLLRARTTMPVIARTAAQIAELRGDCLAALQELVARPVRLDDPLSHLLRPNFYLAYHNEDDTPFQVAAAQLYRQWFPSLSTVPPEPKSTLGRRLRIGFVSENFENHTIGLLFAETIARLPAERFERVIFYVPSPGSEVQRALLASVDGAVPLGGTLAQCRDLIAAQRLDILVYTDVGMSGLTYFLAMSRLAPVQCVSWGHPVTTGMDSVDAFLTCDAMEPENGEKHYTEKLIRLPGLSLFYRRPLPPVGDVPDRAQLGLPLDATLYVCPQTLFKLHPDNDRVVAAILAGDPRGRLVLIGHGEARVTDVLLERMAGSGVPPDRVIVLPRLSRGGFIGLLRAADVMLDPLHYSGGNTSLEAIAQALPIVTLPGHFMRSRHTYGLYRLLGVNDCVADNEEHYVRLAVRLGTDAAWRAEVSARIAELSGALFEDQSCVDAWADALQSLAMGTERQ